MPSSLYSTSMTPTVSAPTFSLSSKRLNAGAADGASVPEAGAGAAAAAAAAAARSAVAVLRAVAAATFGGSPRLTAASKSSRT